MTKSRAFAFTALISILTACSGAAKHPRAPTASVTESTGMSARLQQQLSGVVKIESHLEGVNLRSIGSGFFINRTGLVLTSFHILRDAAKPGVKLKVSSRDGRSTDNVRVLACGDERGVDLCLLKVPLRSTYAFRVQTRGKPQLGADVHVIGHPQGFEYTLSKGNLSALRPPKTATDADMIQITAPISPGNSGGPVLDNKGLVLGISTAVWDEEGTQNINFAVSAKEIARFVNHNLKKPGVGFETFAHSLRQYESERARAHFTKHLQASFERVVRGHQAPDPHHFRKLEFALGTRNLASWVHRDLAQNCQDASTPEWFKHRCSNETGLLEVQAKSGSRDTFINALEAGALPITLVEDMQASGEWTEVSRRLNPHQVEKFFSRVIGTRCYQRSARGGVRDAKPEQAEYCIQKIVNFPDLGGVMYSIVGYSPKEKMVLVTSVASLNGFDDHVIERHAEILFHGTRLSARPDKSKPGSVPTRD